MHPNSGQDVDFIIGGLSSLEVNQLKSKLVAMPHSPFIQRAMFFYYRTPLSQEIQIDFVPEEIVSTPRRFSIV